MTKDFIEMQNEIDRLWDIALHNQNENTKLKEENVKVHTLNLKLMILLPIAILLNIITIIRK